MRTIWLVAKHEIVRTLQQRSFWLLTILMPLLLVGIQAYAVIVDQDLDSNSTGEMQASENAPAAAAPRIGLIDEAGLIQTYPPGFPSDLLIPFPNPAAARSALESGQIDQAVWVPADYLATGEVRVFDTQFQFLPNGSASRAPFDITEERVIAYLINANLIDNAELVNALQDPTPGLQITRHVLRPPESAQADRMALALLVGTVIPYVLYFLLVLGSSYLMRSVVAEKENRTAEVLLVSVSPRGLMVGKILGLGVVTFIQFIIWVGGGALALNRGSSLMNVANFEFPTGFLLWAVCYLILGYLLYGSVMAAAGAIANNAREAAQVTWLLILPLLPTLMFGQDFVQEPDSGLALFLSLFPLSAPSAMVTRLAVAPVPFWQLAISLGGLLLTTYVFVLLAARFFRSGNLLSGASFEWRRMISAWRG